MIRLMMLMISLAFFVVACDSNETTEGGYNDTEDGYTVDVDTVFLDSFFISNKDFEKHKEDVKEFYKSRNYRSAWFKDKEPKPQAKMLIERLKNANVEGLTPDQFDQNKIAALENTIKQGSFKDEEIRNTDIALTNFYFQYADQVNQGVIDPKEEGLSWNISQKENDLVTRLDSILKIQNAQEDPFVSLEPQHQQYRLLRAHLAEYQHIKNDGGWQQIQTDKLKHGDSSEAVVKLRKRLFITKDIPDTSSYFSRSMYFDSTLVKAVKHFQRRHGLQDDGIVAGNTLAELNISVEERIQQIKINMERFRWLPENMGNPHVLVNIPAYKMYVRNNDEQLMEMKVITGQAVNQTVLFSDSIEYIVFSPYWWVPQSIASEEIIPKATGNPGYLARNNYEVVAGNDVVNPSNVNLTSGNYTIRQKPGKSNALGTVKFIFPNKYNIYLHDTNAPHLFERTNRDFSHGCIRIEKPEQFAMFLLQDKPEWNEQRIQEARNQESPERIYLDKKVPVYVLYFTTWIDIDGTLHFREDIYNHDGELSKKLFATK